MPHTLRNTITTLLLLTFITAGAAFAGPMSPFPFDAVQPDGSSFKVKLRGDEFQNWAESVATGHTVIQNPETGVWEYAEQTPDGMLKGSGIIVGSDGANAPAEIPRGIRPLKNQNRADQLGKILQEQLTERITVPKVTTTSSGVGKSVASVAAWVPQPVSGTKKLLVVLVNFSNQRLKTSATDWEKIIFDTTPGVLSVANYYKDNSFGALTIAPANHTQTDNPVGVVSVSIAYNHPNMYDPNHFSQATENMVNNLALAQAASYVDFNSFDTNSNGTLEQSELSIYFVYAGYETSGTTKRPGISGHTSNVTSPGITAGTKSIIRLAQSGELNDAGVQMPMGIIAHELGHAICGLPDLYDTSYTNGGMGAFSLMAAGSWGADYGEYPAIRPAALDAWSREFLGWTSPVVPQQQGLISIGASLSGANNAVKLVNSATSTTEYWLAENRYPLQGNAWDRGVRTLIDSPDWLGGLLISHIDITMGTPGLNNIDTYTGNAHQGVVVEQANTTFCNMVGFDATCAYGNTTTLFYEGNNSTFNDISIPDSKYYSMVSSNLGLVDISNPGSTMTAFLTTPPVTGGYVMSVAKSGTGTGIVSSASGDISCGPVCTASESSGAAVTLTASAGIGSEFSGWSGACSGTGSCHITIDEAKNVTATFSTVSPVLTVRLIGSGIVTPDSGTISWSGDTGVAAYATGTVVTLTASASSGTTFMGWNGACTGMGACRVTMGTAKSIAAIFAIAPLPVTGVTTSYAAGDDGAIQAGTALPSLRFNDNGDQTITDHLTGLVWSKDANPAGAKTWQGALDYIKQLNVQNWLGHNDWRLPNVKEWQSIILNYASMGASNIGSFRYWSSDTYTTAPSSAWTVVMAGGIDDNLKSNTYLIWPVRAGQPSSSIAQTGQAACYSTTGNKINCNATGQDGEFRIGISWPSQRFSDNGDQSITDNLTGLIWSKDANPAGAFDWQHALGAITSLNQSSYLGHNDWRLPNIHEVSSLINWQSSPSSWLNKQGFSNIAKGYYWSSSAGSRFASWAVNMISGYTINMNSDGNVGYVFPVRGGQITLAYVYIVTPSAGSNGSISPATPQPVTSGSTTSFTVIPNSGYQIASVTGCGGSLSGSTYTTGAITGACTVSASFSIIPPSTYAVTPTAGANGSISPATAQTVTSGSTTSFTVTPASGYQISSVTGCNGTLSGSTYTTGAITGACTVSANFSAIPPTIYTVTPTAGANGSISPATPQTVTSGATTSFTITPATGYQIATVTGCNGTLSGSTYTTGAITAACTVTASFSAIPTSTTLKGDVNGDNKIDIFDALLTLQYGLNLIPHDATSDANYLAHGDVAPLDSALKPKGDSKIDIMDALVILQRSVNLLSW